MFRLPLFPLGGFVLFPRTHAPLHVFETRYRRMLADVLAGDRRLAMAHLRPGYEKDYHGAPRVFRIVTVVRVLMDEKVEDGRYNILVEGIERGEVLEEIQERPYRVARVIPVIDDMSGGGHDEVAREAAVLARLAESIGARVAPKARALQNMVNTHLHPGIIADVAAHLLVSDPYDRQGILEEADVLRRIRLVSVQLHRLHERINAGDVELPVAEN